MLMLWREEMLRSSDRDEDPRRAIPIELYMALAICIVIEILGALVWRFLMIECGKEKSRPWEAEALENEGGTPFHSG
jgi:hypothetical protein